MRPGAIVLVAAAQVNSAFLPGPTFFCNSLSSPLGIVKFGHAGSIRVNPALGFSLKTDKSPFKPPLLSPQRHVARFPALIVLLDEDLMGAQRLTHRSPYEIFNRVNLRCRIQTLCGGTVRFLMRA